MAQAEIKSTPRADGTVHHVLHTGNCFARAVVAHFKLPGGQVDADMQVHAQADELFGLTLRICLTAEDVAAIGELMKKSRDVAQPYQFGKQERPPAAGAGG